MTFGELLDHHAEVRGDAPAVISHPQSRTVSFRDLRNRSIQLARAFAQDGIGKGDLVALSLGSRVEYFETFFACVQLGAALVLLNYAYTDSEMLALLKVVKPKIMVASPGFAYYDNTQTWPKIVAEVTSVKRVVIMDDIEGKYHLDTKMPRFSRYEDYLQPFDADPAALPHVSISCHDMVNVQFTSGSTGLPKSVALSHYNIMNCGRHIWQQTRMASDHRICLPVPLFHSFDTTDRSTIKFGIIAGAAMPPELLRRITTVFPIPRLYTCWDMTELSSFATMMHETDPYEKRIRTAGKQSDRCDPYMHAISGPSSEYGLRPSVSAPYLARLKTEMFRSQAKPFDL
ncbi:hypothetical protein LTR27_001147 [Elasticomyces elasticus]|nr:hypothetical protein LTR27_001147 [Elasticomyces elasticus]